LATKNTLILRHYEEDRPAMVETDASDYAMGAVLSQSFEDCKIHPVAFISKKFSPAEPSLATVYWYVPVQ
jgi:hypothetical protein